MTEATSPIPTVVIASARRARGDLPRVGGLVLTGKASLPIGELVALTRHDGLEMTLPRRETIPPLEEIAPPPGEIVPPLEEIAPPHREIVPPPLEIVPPHREIMLAQREIVLPRGGGVGSGGQEVSGAGDAFLGRSPTR